MKHSPLVLALLVLGMMTATAVALNHISSRHKLGVPGVKTRPMTDSKNLEILLPSSLPGYESEISTQSEVQLLKLPPDTSFRSRTYQAPDGFGAQVTVVLMGTDRSSIHKPQICLTGQGWTIDESLSRQEDISMERPYPYSLRVNKLVTSIQIDRDGRPTTVHGLFVYWFVDADHLTADASKWMLWWMPHDLLTKGTLDRWAYISYFTICQPGSEDLVFGRLKEFIAESVPEYQLVPSGKANAPEVAR